jgi:hypothetical protein
MFKMPGTVTALLVAGMGLALTITLAACSTESCGLGPCGSLCNCNPGDQTLTSGQESDYSEVCPTYRECYSPTNLPDVGYSCGSTLCMLPNGKHCDDTLSCNPGDIQMPQGDQTCVEDPSLCYTKYLCTRFITCLNPAIHYGSVCSGISSDGGLIEPEGASADGRDAGRIPCCGDGILDSQYDEQCDLGPLNGVCLDSQGNPGNEPNCSVSCTQSCLFPPL